MKAAHECKQSFPTLDKELANWAQMSQQNAFIIIQIFVSDCVFELVLTLLKNFKKN